MKLKGLYAQKRSEISSNSIYLSKRLFNTYNRIAVEVLSYSLKGVNADLGSGDGSFSVACESFSVKSFAFDYHDLDLEKDRIPLEDCSVDFVTLNAVIEHLYDPSNILSESYRILKKEGLIFIRTPNWKIDYKNFFNDPTHVKPYSPDTLRNVLNLYSFKLVFLGPGLVEKKMFWWKLPDVIKWRAAALIKGGTKSIIAVGQKK